MDAQTTLGLMLFQNGDQAERAEMAAEGGGSGRGARDARFRHRAVQRRRRAAGPGQGYAYVSRAASVGLAPAKQTLDQLDQLLPANERKRGLEVARELAKAAPTEKTSRPKPVETAAAKAPPKPAAKPAPKPAATPAAKSWPKRRAAATKPAVEKAACRQAGIGGFSSARFLSAAMPRRYTRNCRARRRSQGRQPFYVAAGSVTRLQVGPFESSAAAQAACKAVGVPCFPVRAK